MSDDNRPTTAKALGNFHKELVEEGIDEELANALVQQAAAQILSEVGLVVTNG